MERSEFMRNTMRGVTLIELMTVVVIVAILASIAVPSYRSYLLRSQRTDAKTALLRIQSGMEKYLVQNGKYTTKLDAKPDAGGLGLTTVSEQGFYNLGLDLTPDGVGYVATATVDSLKGQKDDKKCNKLTIDQTGKKGAADAGGTDNTAECWR
jgi:type IV pilus assembly protein PilE